MSRSTLLAIRGLVAIGLGAIALAAEPRTLFFVVVMWGTYALADGMLALLLALNARFTHRREWWLVEGAAATAASVTIFVWPAIALRVIAMLIVVWSLLGGLVEVIASIELRRVIARDWLLAACGILSVGFGVALALLGDRLATVWAIGAYALASGVLMLALAARLELDANRLREQRRGTRGAPSARSLP